MVLFVDPRKFSNTNRVPWRDAPVKGGNRVDVRQFHCSEVLNTSITSKLNAFLWAERHSRHCTLQSVHRMELKLGAVLSTRHKQGVEVKFHPFVSLVLDEGTRVKGSVPF
jgi:hypothetical protein